jgi:predicted  nucleic acid-binding Zn-ribbon protein
MKKLVMTAAVMAFLMGGFCNSASAKEATNTVSIEIVAGDNWDKVLDEYEKYVDQYIKTYKKAMSGDMTAMNEYVKLAEKAQKLAEKLENAEDEMTPAQLKRYAKITEKMTNALLDD